jgi:hypothetical protein
MAQGTRSQSATVALVAGVLIAGALAVGFLIHARDERPSSAKQRIAAVPTSTAASQADPRIELLQAQIAGLNDRLADSERLAKAGRDAQRTPEPEPTANAEQPPPETRWTDGAKVSRRFDQRFEAQAVDGAWAVSESRSLRTFIDSSAPRARVEALECRSSMCRARLGFVDRKDRQAFVTRVASPEFAPAAYMSTDAESNEVTLFTARAGRDLPDVSAE